MAIDLSVTGMTCEHCVRAVTKALAVVAGAGNVSVNLGAGRARVDGMADERALLRAVEQAGYQAEVLPSK